jgi:hypothetical protein
MPDPHRGHHRRGRRVGLGCRRLRLCNRLAAPRPDPFRGADLASREPLVTGDGSGWSSSSPPFGGTVRDNLRVAAADADDDRMARGLERAHLSRVLDRVRSSRGRVPARLPARTLVTEPEVLLGRAHLRPDEAARHAPASSRELADGGVPAIWVTHDLDQARRLADWVIVPGGRVRAMELRRGWPSTCARGRRVPSGDVGALGVATSLVLVARRGRRGAPRAGATLVWATTGRRTAAAVVALALVADPGDSPIVLSRRVAACCAAADARGGARRRCPGCWPGASCSPDRRRDDRGWCSACLPLEGGFSCRSPAHRQRDERDRAGGGASWRSSATSGSVEARLALAALAARLRADGLRAALVPQIETTKAVGIVFLPGAMTGLSRLSTRDAVLVQYRTFVLGSAVTGYDGRGDRGRRLFTPTTACWRRGRRR